MADGEPTRIMMGANESTIKGYPHASISSRGAFDWTLQKIVRSNISGFKLLFLHVQVPDEDEWIVMYSSNEMDDFWFLYKSGCTSAGSILNCFWLRYVMAILDLARE
ncbi:hypothetical protein SAY86_015945 [Trapa natans]|uniref:Uncharacterized protein n=1 Tax=Trapa natans TaxID=22666 RepID=A0AAN7L5D7_TRANT|nr:hypothetical protein SAY86_015945 [Trapa natans]